MLTNNAWATCRAAIAGVCLELLFTFFGEILGSTLELNSVCRYVLFMFSNVLLLRGSEVTHGLDYVIAYTLYSGCLVWLWNRHLSLTDIANEDY